MYHTLGVPCAMLCFPNRDDLQIRTACAMGYGFCRADRGMWLTTYADDRALTSVRLRLVAMYQKHAWSIEDITPITPVEGVCCGGGLAADDSDKLSRARLGRYPHPAFPPSRSSLA